jgi:hypothetical protein
VATINAAAAVHVVKRGKIAAFAVIIAAGLAGCSTNGGSLLESSNSPLATESTAATTNQARAKIALAPVIGAPSTIASQIVAQVSSEIAKQNIAVAKTPNETVDYTLRGYIVAAREASGTKVSYIWDVTNPTGARVHRITGEELVKGAGPGDPWASVSPQLVQVIAAKTGNELGQWMPKRAPAPSAPASSPVAALNSTSQQTANTVAAAGTAAATQTASNVTSAASRATTGSIPGSGSVTALVPTVVGAPGDGSRSLAAALRNELMRNGVKPAAPGVPSYRVEGRVKMGAAESGQQPIKIDWVVKDPGGKSLGTVSQENKIPAGSLDGQWGGTATAAAVAATQGILKLLPQQTASR